MLINHNLTDPWPLKGAICRVMQMLLFLSRRCGLWVWHLLHVCAEACHQDPVAGAGQHWSDVAARASHLASERAPLRRPDGPQQGRDGGQTRRGPGEDLENAPTTSHHHPWTPSTTSTPPSARWAGHWQPPEMCQISMLDWFLKGHVTLNVMSLQDRRYGDLTEDQLPSCESLKDTIARALPFWNEEIVPQIKEGKRVLIAAHGNSLRGIVKHLEGEKPSQTP